METLKIYMKKLTLEEFIEKAHKIHGDKFDYSKVIFKGLAYKITIICPNGHEFEQLAGSHLNGRACPECRKSKPLTTKTFIDRAIKVHKDKGYNYSRVVYINYTTAVEIGCPIHGYFWQLPTVHLRGCGCQACVGNAKVTKDNFIKRANEIHNFKYDYSDTVFKNLRSYINYKCPEHGEISQFARHHLEGYGCSRCTGRTLTCKDFTDRMKEIHRR